MWLGAAASCCSVHATSGPFDQWRRTADSTGLGMNFEPPRSLRSASALGLLLCAALALILLAAAAAQAQTRLGDGDLEQLAHPLAHAQP